MKLKLVFIIAVVVFLSGCDTIGLSVKIADIEVFSGMVAEGALNESKVANFSFILSNNGLRFVDYVTFSLELYDESNSLIFQVEPEEDVFLAPGRSVRLDFNYRSISLYDGESAYYNINIEKINGIRQFDFYAIPVGKVEMNDEEEVR